MFRISLIVIYWAVFISACSTASKVSYSADSSNVVEWLRHLAETGHSEARIILLDQATQGYSEAQFVLGVHYSDGIGVPRDMIQARHWYKLAAGQGHEAALESLVFLASGGDAAALHIIGVLRRDGVESSRDLPSVREAFQGAGALGYIPAIYSETEQMLKTGDENYGSVRVIRKYRQIVRLSFKQLEYPEVGSLLLSFVSKNDFHKNRALAQYAMGMIYYYGLNDIGQSFANAVKWFKRAAHSDLADAQYVLGCLYELGRGVSQDRIRARQWYEKSMANEDKAVKIISVCSKNLINGSANNGKF